MTVFHRRPYSEVRLRPLNLGPLTAGRTVLRERYDLYIQNNRKK